MPRRVSQDYEQAAEWFTKAAEQGYAEAQYNLGVMYDFGQGVPQDYNEAGELISKGARRDIQQDGMNCWK